MTNYIELIIPHNNYNDAALKLLNSILYMMTLIAKVPIITLPAAPVTLVPYYARAFVAPSFLNY